MAEGPGDQERHVRQLTARSLLLVLVVASCSIAQDTSKPEPTRRTSEVIAPDENAPTPRYEFNEPQELIEFSEGYRVGSAAPIGDAIVSCEMASNASGDARAVSSVTNTGPDQARYSFEVTVFDGNRRIRFGDSLRIDYVAPAATGLEIIDYSGLAFAETLRCEATAASRSPYHQSGLVDQDRLQVGPCVVAIANDQVSTVEVSFEMTNTSDQRLTYLIDANIYDADGVGLKTLDFAREIESGASASESLLWNYFGFDPMSLSCETIGLRIFGN